MSGQTTSLPAYERILFEDLQVTEGFLKEHESILASKLLRAAEDLERPRGEFNAINQCFRLASSVVLRGSTKVNTTLEHIQADPAFADKDPTTIVTISALYYLLKHVSEHAANANEENKFKRIIQRFAEMNWMIGADGMDALNIDHH